MTDDISQASRSQGGAARPESSSANLRVSLIIPIYNGEQTIERCLDAVFAQEVDFDYEVIVADSSTDATPRIIADRFPAVRYVRLEKRARIGVVGDGRTRAARAPARRRRPPPETGGAEPSRSSRTCCTKGRR